MSEFNAEYTETLDSFIELNPTWLEDNLKMSTTDRTDSLCSMIKSIWFFNEISGETEGQFKIFMIRKFEEYKCYYEEKLDNYTKKFNYEEGLIETRTSTKTGNVKNNSSAKVTPNTIDTHYDLPNKQTTNEYPSYKDTSTGDTSSVGSLDSDTTDNVEDTIKYNDRFITLKNAYMKQIRDLYHEFAEKFSPCFLHLY